MDAPSNLATLDPSIIRQIIDQSEYVGELRLISPNWNNLVGECPHPSNLGALERLYLYTNIEAEEEQFALDMHLRNIKEKMGSKMVAILREQDARNIGVGSWLEVINSHDGGAIEVSSKALLLETKKDPVNPAELQSETPDYIENEPLVVELDGFGNQMNNVPGREEHCLIFSIASGLFSIGFLLAFSFMGPNLIGFIIIIVLAYRIYVRDDSKREDQVEIADPFHMEYDLMNPGSFPNAHAMTAEEDYLALNRERALKKKTEKKFPQLSRFISRFSHIETLVLNDFLMVEITSFTEKVHDSLGTVKIDRLEICCEYFGDKQQSDIVELCRKHRIQHVFVKSITFRMNDFAIFAEEMVKMGAVVDIYDIDDYVSYFNKPRDFFDEMTRQLEKKDVLMRLMPKDDPSFADGGYGEEVFTHLRCEKYDPLYGPMMAVEIKRGFNIELEY